MSRTQRVRLGAIRMWMDSVTMPDGHTYDIVRVLAVLSVFTFLSLSGYDVLVAGNDFEMQEFGIAVGAIFAGTGGALMMKREADPTPTETEK